MSERCKCGTDALGGCRIHTQYAFRQLEAEVERLREALQAAYDALVLHGRHRNAGTDYGCCAWQEESEDCCYCGFIEAKERALAALYPKEDPR